MELAMDDRMNPSVGMSKLRTTVPTKGNATIAPSATEVEGSSVWSSDVDNDKDDDDDNLKSALTAEDKKTRRRAQIAKSARKHRVRQKAELHELRAQVQDLTAALASCRRNCRRPTAESIPSLDLSDEHEDFGVQASLRGLWLNAPLQTADTGPGPNVYHPFHRLTADPAQRHGALLAIAKPASLRMYNQILEDTHSIPSFPPYVDVRMTSMGENVSIKFCRVCEITNFDHKTVSDVFWTIFWGFGDDNVVTNAGLCRRKRILQVDATSHYEHVAYSVPNMPDVRLESLDVVTRTSDPHYTIFTWESIDQDDLFPAAPPDYHPTATTVIRREEIGSVMFRTESDADGNIRTVLRTVIYSRPFVQTLPKKTTRDMNEPFAHLYCRLNVVAEEHVSRYLLQKFMSN